MTAPDRTALLRTIYVLQEQASGLYVWIDSRDERRVLDYVDWDAATWFDSYAEAQRAAAALDGNPDFAIVRRTL